MQHFRLALTVIYLSHLDLLNAQLSRRAEEQNEKKKSFITNIEKNMKELQWYIHSWTVPLTATAAVSFSLFFSIVNDDDKAEKSAEWKKGIVCSVTSWKNLTIITMLYFLFLFVLPLSV